MILAISEESGQVLVRRTMRVVEVAPPWLHGRLVLDVP
jgi:hypothetical protein